MTVVLGGLALALTVSGLVSILSYLVEQRAKEIGVRIALGATTQNIAALVLSQSARPVGFGLLAGGGLAAVLAIVLMSTLGSESGNTVRVFDPMAYAASLLVIVIACVLAASVPAVRAARVDPIATLRNTEEVTARAASSGLQPHRAGQPAAEIVQCSEPPRSVILAPSRMTRAPRLTLGVLDLAPGKRRSLHSRSASSGSTRATRRAGR